MIFRQLGVAVFWVFFFMANNAFSAGAPVNEDFSLVISLCDDMLEMARKSNKDGFVELADAALNLSEALRRDNSMAIDRFRPKLRAAKKAAKSDDFNQAITLVGEAKALMKPTKAAWDGGT